MDIKQFLEGKSKIEGRDDKTERNLTNSPDIDSVDIPPPVPEAIFQPIKHVSQVKLTYEMVKIDPIEGRVVLFTNLSFDEFNDVFVKDTKDFIGQNIKAVSPAEEVTFNANATSISIQY
jgi:hypothetical protein